MNALRLIPRSALQLGAWLLLMAWLAWLGRDSWQLVHSLSESSSAAPAETAARPKQAPDQAAIAQLFGVLPQEAGVNQPRVPLSLLASLVESRPELSRALIESPEGRRFYRIGEALPGGGSLREIGTTQVRLQRYGEDQAITLASHATPLLIPLPAAQELPSSSDVRADLNSLVQPSL